MTGAASPILGCERSAGKRTYLYYSVKSFAPVVSIECATNYSVWETLKIEQVVSGRMWAHQDIIDCADTHFEPLANWYKEGQ